MKATTDPIIPTNHISWQQLVVAERLNMERTETVVKTTFARIQAKQAELGFKSLIQFSRHYNCYSNEIITDKSVNYFLTIGTIAPIAHQIKLFVSSRVSQARSDRKGGNIYLVYDFGILRSHYEYFKKTGTPKQVFNRGGTKQNFTPAAENGRTKIEFDGGGVLDVPKNDIYRQFTEGIKAANAVSTRKVTIPQMTLFAMQMFMESRPDVFGALEQTVTPDSLITKKTNDRISAEIAPELRAGMAEAIQRYNSANPIGINQSQFVEVAIKGMLERLPVEYVDPKLARALKKREGKNEA